MQRMAAAGLLSIGLIGAAQAEPDESPSAYDLKMTGISHESLSVFENREDNLTMAAFYYRQAAEKGNARAWQLLANAYRHGRGVDQSAFLAVVSYLVPKMMCFAVELPSESAGVARDVTQKEWEDAIRLSS